MDPAAVYGLNNALCTKDHAEFFTVGKGIKSRFKCIGIKLLYCFCAIAYEYLVSVVMVVLVMVVMVVMVSTAALLAVIVVMLVLVMVLVAAALLAVIVVMLVLVIVLVAAALLVVIVVVLVLVMVLMVAALLIVIVVMAVLVMVLVAAALLIVIVVMLMLMMVMVMPTATLFAMIVVMCLLLEPFNFGFKCRGSFNCIKQLCAGKLIPIGRNYNRIGIMLLYKCNALVDLILVYKLCMAKYYARGILYLIVKELTKVLHMHLTLLGVNNGCKSTEDCTLCICTPDCLYNVGELTNARGLNKDSIGSKPAYYLCKSLGKITDK